MASYGMLPSGLPDLSSIKDFETEADARVCHEEEEPSSPVDNENLHSELRELEERLQERRKAPRKPSETLPKETPEGEEEEPLKALYFVRLPKPDFDSPTYDLLQHEFEAQLAQVKIYAEHRRVQNLKKSEARKDTNKALACLKEANTRVNEQREKLTPYREQRAVDRKAREALRDPKKGIPAATEKELDLLIRGVEFRMEHETVSFAEEKELFNEIKRLKAARPAVREHEKKNADTAANARTDLTPANKEHLEKELKEFRVEQSMYEKMYKDLRDIERGIDEELRQICSQLDSAAKKKDAIYQKLSAARQRRRMRKNEWQRNRDFSRHIRCLVDEKRIEEAQEECMEQTNALLSILTTEADYRQEYLSMWSTKRNNPMAVFEDETAEAKKAPAKPVKKKSTLHADVKVLPGQSIPEAVVASMLKKAAAKTHVEAAKPKKVIEIQTPVPVEETGTPKPNETDRAPAKAPPAAKPVEKPKKAIVNEGFELPAVIAETAKEPETSEKTEEAPKPKAEVAERQRMERIEAQKKKRAEQSRKKKAKEEEQQQKAATEVKPKEVVVKPQPAQPKKQATHPKKQTVRSRGGDQLVSKLATTGARPGKRKTKGSGDKVMGLLKEYQYHIPVAILTVLLCIGLIYALL